MGKWLRVTQHKSGIGRLQNQKLTLKGLGITRRGRTAYVMDTPSARGQIATVAHLVDWSEVSQKERDAAASAKKTPSFEVVGPTASEEEE